MANWNSHTLLDLGRGFMEPRIFLTAAELDVFTHLYRRPMGALELADELKADERGLRTVLDALVAMEVLAKDNEVYLCPGEVGELLSADSPQTILPMVRHSASLWGTWSKLSDIARGPDGPVLQESDWLQAFIGGMHVLAGPIAEKLVRVVEAFEAKRLIDVGGASGSYTIAFLKAHPEMTATLFDRPQVMALAKERLAESKVDSRVSLVGGDFLVDKIPGGHDLAWVSAIIHSLSLEQNLALYKNVFQALEPGGRIIIRDQVMSPDRTEPKSGAIFAINMLVGTGVGGTYTYAEIEQGLLDAGFEKVGFLHDAGGMDSLVEAYKPQ